MKSVTPTIIIVLLLLCNIGFANTVETACGTFEVPSFPKEYIATASCSENGWTHYYEEGTKDWILFSIKNDGVVNIAPQDVKIVVRNDGFTDLTNIDYATADVPWIVMNRYWEVSPTAQPLPAGVTTRVYFTDNEFQNVKNEVNRQGGTINTPYDLIAFCFDESFSINPDPTLATPHVGATTENFNQHSHTIGTIGANGHFVEIIVNKFSGGGIGGSTVGRILPIELVDFTVSEVEKEVEIKWTTVAEVANAYFAVMHSIDGIRFREIDRLDGAGSSSTPTNYRTFDENPSLGLNYYRLKQIDIDGKSTLSEIKVLKFRGTKFIDIVPTMVINQARIDIPIPFDIGASIKIFDSNGRLVLQSRFLSNEQRKTLDLSKLSTGNYLVKVSDGNIFLSKRFIKVDGQ